MECLIHTNTLLPPKRTVVLSEKSWGTDFAQLNTAEILPCEVVFGSPQMSCRGTGICKLVGYGVQPSDIPRSCRRNPAFLVPTKDKRALALVFRRELLCVNVLRTQFRNNQMTLKTSFQLPEALGEKMGIKTLQAGVYPLETFDGHFLIRFQGA